MEIDPVILELRAELWRSNAGREAIHRRNATLARRDADRFWRRGISKSQFDILLAFQGAKCALCERQDKPQKYKRLHIDHCHASGMVRGLLCVRCNVNLARFGDDLTGIQRVVAYLENPPAAAALGWE